MLSRQRKMRRRAGFRRGEFGDSCVLSICSVAAVRSPRRAVWCTPGLAREQAWFCATVITFTIFGVWPSGDCPVRFSIISTAPRTTRRRTGATQKPSKAVTLYPASCAGKPVPALWVRRVDVAKLSAHPIRALRGRCYLSLQERQRGASAMERVAGTLCGLQAGAASREDEDRLLQGCEPPWRLSEPVVRLSRIYLPGEESVGKGASSLCVLPARRQSEGVDVHQPN